MRTLIQDVRHALRLFGRNPAFTVVSALTIALAIGGCTAVFSVVNGVLLSPLPYPEPDRIVSVAEEHPGSPSTLSGLLFSNHTYHAWAPTAKTVTAVGAYNQRRYTVSGEGMPEADRVPGTSVSPSLMRVLGVAPQAGRTFEDADAKAGAAPVVLLSHEFWTSRLNGDPSAVGRVLRLDGVARQVVGIMPPGFAFPDKALIYTPYDVPASAADGVSIFAALARMAPGVTPEQVHAEATAAARSVNRPFVMEVVFGKGGTVEVPVQRLSERLTETVRPALVVLAVGIGLVLLIACANVTNLFLSRGVARSREMAVRAALGAGRGRLLRQLLAESLLLSAMGGALGVFLGWMLTRTIPALAPASFPRLAEIQVDGSVLLVSVVLSLVAGTLSGLLPALRGSRTALSSAMRSGDVRTATASGRGSGPVLLALEAALAVVLLVGAALLGRSFANLLDVDPGYDPAGVLTANMVQVSMDDEIRFTAAANSVLERVRAMPGVEAAGAANMAPFGGSTAISGFTLPGAVTADGQPVQARALSHTITPGYMEALGMRVVEGRLPTQADAAPASRAMLVNEAFAQTYLGDGRPVVGRRYTGLMGDDKTPFEIIGIVANTLPADLDGKPEPSIYITQGGEFALSRATFVVRTSGDPSAIGPALRAVVRETEPSAVALDAVATLSSQVAASVGQPRFAASVLGIFAMLALSLAAIGLYGVLSYNVSARRREMGVRAALGAERRNLIGLVMRQGLGVTVIGLVAGVVAAALLTRLMETMLFGVKALDVVSFVAAPAVLFVVACVACVVPALRAARVDPAVALRADG
ncbi:MAG: ABC transporter permease [Acidobacteriota bacterium]|nr:ABC transporter permease [Acidobacteriota bacterium]